MKTKITIISITGMLLFFLHSSKAQVSFPQASPTQKLTQNFATSKIEIEYSRPGVKGRTAFGDLVPWDSVWRTGANSSTKIFFGEDVKLDGHDVAKGKYALYTIPEKNEWTIIISKDTSLWGAFGYKEENDLLRFTVKPSAIPLTETFFINITNIKDDACDIQLSWEKTTVSFHVTADVDSKIMSQIDEALKGEKPPYFSSASYYYEHGKDLNKAYEWVNKAIALRPDAYYMMALKAKIELKLGKKNDALATAEAGLPLAQKADDTGYMSQFGHLIEQAKK